MSMEPTLHIYLSFTPGDIKSHQPFTLVNHLVLIRNQYILVFKHFTYTEKHCDIVSMVHTQTPIQVLLWATFQLYYYKWRFVSFYYLSVIKINGILI